MDTLVYIIGFAFFGLVVGAIARTLVPGRQSMSMFMTMLMGVLGSYAGGLLLWLFRGAPENAFEPAHWIMSIIGAVIVVAIYASAVMRPRHV